MTHRADETTERRDRDLGIGARVADLSSQRLLNRDGSFNTERTGLGLLGSLSLYNSLLTLSWPAFILFWAPLTSLPTPCSPPAISWAVREP